ncbi:MAG: amidohydrolase family protein [Myxococcota bacterium]|nr:amidohydrolase family protein [Myxococcota bacterium]
MFTETHPLPPGPVLFERIGRLYTRFDRQPLENAWMVWIGGRVDAVGQGDPPAGNYEQICDLKGLTIIPAPIDAHTHALFAGDRSEEFGARFDGGDSYAERLARGGGIRSTVRSVADTKDDHLVQLALDRIHQSMACGVCAMEIKTGYGLSIDGERRLMGLLHRVQSYSPIPIFPTLLMHVPLPNQTPASLLAEAQVELLPLAESLGFGVDIFVEEGAFSCEDARPFLEDAAQRNLPIHVHAEQLTLSGAAKLAASVGACSADHLEFIDEASCEALAEAGTVANLLPGAWLQLGGGQRPPVPTLRHHGVTMAVSTDWNPGSSYIADPLLAASLAVTSFGLRPMEALCGVTLHAAKALGAPSLGHLDVEGEGRPWVLAEPSPEALLQRMGIARRGGVFTQSSED